MPWIKGAVVRKIWPDKLSIALAEHTPIAIWNDAEFLSSDGAIFQLPFDKLKEKIYRTCQDPIIKVRKYYKRGIKCISI